MSYKETNLLAYHQFLTAHFLELEAEFISAKIFCIGHCYGKPKALSGFTRNQGEDSEKAMAPHSSVLAWRIPGTGEPGGLPSMGLHRVRHD